MIFIKKSTPPSELEVLKKYAEEHELSDKEGYNLLRNPLKENVRKSLLKEQGYLCAYCMRRLPDERISIDDEDHSNVYIEHWQARRSRFAHDGNKGLDYRNMLAVCSGNEIAPEAVGRRKRRFLTCDKKRDNSPLKINPLNNATIETIYYNSEGFIASTDCDIENDLNINLNLNCESDAVRLPKNRKAALDVVQESILNSEGDILQNCIDQLSIWENEEIKTPYIGIVLWWLKDQISALSSQ